MVIDGYNLIFAMPEYAELARDSLETARKVLMDRLCGYAAYTGREVVLVFDGWKVPGNPGDKQEHHNIKVVFTREKETGDAWIERFIAQIGKNQQVRVVSSDWLVQLSAVHKGVLRVSAREFGLELADVDTRVREVLDGLELKKPRNNPVIK
jgi:predicted RNA-binding protein with PIN domain